MESLNMLYMHLLHKIPDCPFGLPKRSKRNIQNLMREYEYDEEYIKNISDEFCQGFGVAREIILTICAKKKYEILKKKMKS